MSVPRPSEAAPIAPPAPAWSLRAARAGDAEAWHALQATIYAEGRAFVGDGPPSGGALAARLRALDPDQGTVRFAELGPRAAPADVAAAPGGLIGWVEAYRMGSRRLQHVAVLTVAVAPRWRGRGVGGALMAELATWGRRRGVRKLQLHVRAGNAGAIALYRRLGYELEGVLREQVAVEGGFEDEWVMALPLDASDGWRP
jgi:ribosomal protein S18 acetylase RimI-like enzyme